MKIAINGFISLKGISGSSRGASLVKVAIDDVAEVVEITPPSHSGSRFQRLVRMMAWDAVGSVRMAKAAGSDIVVHTANTGGAGRQLYSIVIIHDTMVLDHWRLFDPGFVLYARLMFGHAARRASRIVTPSEHSKRQILERWPKLEVRVIPWPPYEAGETVQKSYDQRNDSVLVVSSVDKHKRLPMAISAVAKARQAGMQLKLTLVVRPGNDETQLEQSIRTHDRDGIWITVTSGVSDHELQNLYDSSFCLLVPSLDEGFCLPALEAGRSGTPVVHADRGALPEVVSSEVFDEEELTSFRDYARPSADPAHDEALLGVRLAALGSPAVWEAASAHAVKQASRFTPNRFRREWEELIRELQ